MLNLREFKLKQQDTISASLKMETIYLLFFFKNNTLLLIMKYCINTENNITNTCVPTA